MMEHGRTAALAAAALLAAALSAAAFGPRLERDAERADEATYAKETPSPGARVPASGMAASRLQVRRAPSTMPAAFARPVWRPVAGDSVGRIAGFTRLGDTLVVVDPTSHRVLLLRLDGDSWKAVGGWGRRGGGPGEFQKPAAVAALAGDTIAVAEESGRVQLFTPDGHYQRTESAGFPCLMFAPGIAYGRDGTRWLSGLCAGIRAAADTLFLALFRAPPDGDFAEVVRIPRMTLDFSWGAPLATLRPLSDAGGADGTTWLGIGLDDCVHEMVDGRAAARPRCGLVGERLSSPPPPGLEESRRAAERRGDERMARLLRWGETLPPYFGLLREGDGVVLARPISGDSLVLVPAGVHFDPALARLVAPLRSLVSCVRGACLWYDPDEGLLALHDASGADAAPARAP